VRTGRQPPQDERGSTRTDIHSRDRRPRTMP
jgi:hypothetical protein